MTFSKHWADAAYGYKGAATDATRVAFLFERYQALTSLLPAQATRKKSALAIWREKAADGNV
ncbi:MAG: hypothetical protein Q7J21_11455 [Rugosibacter sp.]|nr:hypothetical protein [Rugosibacter sp.]